MIRGERFEIDLGSDDEQDASQQAARGPLPAAFVGDVLERKPAAATAPSAPTLKSKSGFPEHQKRTVESRFKQQKSERAAPKQMTRNEVPQALPVVAPASGGDAKPKSWEEEEKRRIDEENRHKLAGMSAAEIDEERRELMSSLSPALIERLLKRSNIDSGSSESDLSGEPQTPPVLPDKPKKVATKSVSFAEPQVEDEVPEDDEEDAPPAEALPHDSMHFPRPPQPPDLDPSSATFLDDLHDKYFPSLPADPDKLEWMQASKSTKDAYDPMASAFSAKEIRFSFSGELLAPKTASLIPVTAGLHHHGDAPDAAGYTVAELAHLSRSTYAAQRCIAFQTLGRILYRLGKGEFGDAGEPDAETTGADDTFGELARGLWRVVEHEKVIETLVIESEGQGIDRGKHVSAKAYATEAVWLWRKGGGRRWKAN
ncbi:hypothetical protein LTR36_007653 [Oleoguttula mirabilis]|uniref:Uncharacterized protein n=1 Tax=Oleoguttula mirabilis TaxID=1507867 RepID=A0AAV9JV72_9PEZI|nr:hypothetical protein LTR36_007653 [Oleoguttula mirabilis]